MAYHLYINAPAPVYTTWASGWHTYYSLEWTTANFAASVSYDEENTKRKDGLAAPGMHDYIVVSS
eukprot:3832515-Pleurochrysis_carterae.AAC.5